eukprot:COSAG04_NODE_15081_length_544_cov_1.121348_1_plen_45_part_01
MDEQKQGRVPVSPRCRRVAPHESIYLYRIEILVRDVILGDDRRQY